MNSKGFLYGTFSLGIKKINPPASISQALVGNRKKPADGLFAVIIIDKIKEIITPKIKKVSRKFLDFFIL